MPFPTPDFPSGEDRIMIGLLVHSNPVSIQMNLSGAISQLFEEYFFEQTGQMTPAEAAEYYRNQEWIMGICESIADCIENSDSVRSALGRFMASYTGTIGPESVTNPLSPAETTENLLPADYTCDDDHLMGMARFIVQALHSTFLEIIEEIEVTSNPFEFLTTLIDNVEIVSWIGSVAEIVQWLQDQVIEYYGNSYSQVVEDDISCALWCEFKDTCEVSVDLIIAGYMRVFTEFEVTPPDTNDYTEIIEWITTLVSMPDKLLVTACHWLALQSLRFRSGFGAMVGLRTLEQTIILGSDETDTSHVLCASCDPLPESGMNYDYRTGQLGSYVLGSNYGSYVPDSGYAYYNGQFWERIGIVHPSLPSLTMSEVRIYQYRTYPAGYSSSPACRIVGYDVNGVQRFNRTANWSGSLTENGIPYQVFTLPATYTGIVRLDITGHAVNSSNVTSWRIYGWGYS